MLRISGKRQVIRILLAAILTVSLVMPGALPVEASSPSKATGRIQHRGGAYLRSGPSAGSRKIKVLRNKTKVVITEEVFESRKSNKLRKRWYAVRVSGRKGYVRADQVKSISYSSGSKRTKIRVKYRSGPSTRFAKKGTLKKGTKVTVVLKARIRGSGLKWYKVRRGRDYYYVQASNLTDKKVVTKSKKSKSAAKKTSKKSSSKKSTTKKSTKKTTTKKTAETKSSAKKTATKKTAESGTSDKKTTASAPSTKSTTPAPAGTESSASAVTGKTGTSALAADNTSASSTSSSTAAAKPTPPSTAVNTPTLRTGVEDVTVGSSGITVTGLRYPITIARGGAFSVMGIVSGEQPVEHVLVGVFDASGNMLISNEADCEDTTFDIFTLDNDIKFGTLPVGKFTYKVIVTSGSKKYTAGRYSFTVFKPKGAKSMYNTAIALAWPVGTEASCYKYGSGSATPAYTSALDAAFPNHEKWGKIAGSGASCDVFVSTVCRASGVDSCVPQGVTAQWDHYAKSPNWTEVEYNYEETDLRSGDIIIYKKTNGNWHVCMYVKINGTGCIAEASYTRKLYGYINTSLSKILKSSDKKKIRVYRAAG